MLHRCSTFYGRRIATSGDGLRQQKTLRRRYPSPDDVFLPEVKHFLEVSIQTGKAAVTGPAMWRVLLSCPAIAGC